MKSYFRWVFPLWRLGNVGIPSECLFGTRNQRNSAAISGMLIEIAMDPNIYSRKAYQEIDGYLEEGVDAVYSKKLEHGRLEIQV